jgi:GTP cyclohydrolase I
MPYNMGWEEVFTRLRTMRDNIAHGVKPQEVILSPDLDGHYWPVWGVPRGGQYVVGMLVALWEGARIAERPEEADVIIDDVVESGLTRRTFREETAKPFFALVDKQQEKRDDYIVFPWESGVKDDGETAVRRLLECLGEDVTRPGLVDTPRRVWEAMNQMTAGRDRSVDQLFVTFEVAADEMIIVRDIAFWSLCEHHLMPFHGHCTVGYLPADHVLGLSKISRIVQLYASRLQMQEQMTEQIAQAFERHLKPRGVGVLIEAEHTCMQARGARSSGRMVTSALSGALRTGKARDEFLQLARS